MYRIKKVFVGILCTILVFAGIMPTSAMAEDQILVRFVIQEGWYNEGRETTVLETTVSAGTNAKSIAPNALSDEKVQAVLNEPLFGGSGLLDDNTSLSVKDWYYLANTQWKTKPYRSNSLDASIAGVSPEAAGPNADGVLREDTTFYLQLIGSYARLSYHIVYSPADQRIIETLYAGYNGQYAFNGNLFPLGLGTGVKNPQALGSKYQVGNGEGQYTLDGWYTTQKGADSQKQGYNSIEYKPGDNWIYGIYPRQNAPYPNGNAIKRNGLQMPNDWFNYMLYGYLTANIGYDLNGGEGNLPKGDALPPGAEYAVASGEGLTNGDMVFAGWNTKADGSGAYYPYPSKMVVDGHATLYAMWRDAQAQMYTVNFDLNGGDPPAPQSQSVYENSPLIEPDEPDREGYAFVGWNKSADGDADSFWDFQKDLVTQNQTLYAVWERLSFTLSFDLNGAPGENPPSQNLKYGDLAKDPGDPAWRGYTFLGWREIGNSAYWNFAGTFMPARNITLSAQWSRDLDPIEPNTPTPTPTDDPTPTPPTPAPSPSTPTPRPSPSTQSPIPTIPPSSSPGSQTPAPTDEGAISPAPSAAATPAGSQGPDDGDPTVQIEDPDAPLTNLDEGRAWALLNLILSIIGLIISIALLVRYLVKRNREEDDAQDAAKNQTAQERRKKDHVFTILTIVTGIVSIIVFILTENMRYPMVIVDAWTILMAVFFIAQIVFTCLALKGGKEDGEEASPQKR